MGFSILGSSVQQCLTRINMERIGKFEGNAIGWNENRSKNLKDFSIGKNYVHRGPWRVFCNPVSLEEEFSALQSKKFSKDEEPESEDLRDETLLEAPSNEELKALLLDSERSNLLKKLGEANQQNRFLKRQIQASEDALFNFICELSVVELEIQALISLAQEIANYTIPDGSRKINGKYIQSHLLSRLQAVQEKIAEQIKDVDAAQLQEVPLFWSGMAESVQVMGSFDGWSQGEHLSPDYTDSYTTFSTTLMLRRGRYEIKFLVDGEWQLSPEFPTVGEGLMQNNLLTVE
ncbi:protein PTST, chloroplastic [Primulina huaijiensis]|uniref:protein PTST, chloroplastic n=1 Tax=Primulina huaijiensis TaxID=1492673 RepID=UPI003CC738F9